MAKASKYTSLKLLLSYLLLLGLMAFAVGYLFYQQQKLNDLFKPTSTNSNQLVYTELIRDLYETDNRSKIALQTRSQQNINLFLNENDSILQKLENIKTNLLFSDVVIIDTLKDLLRLKKNNVLELLQLQGNQNFTISIDQVVSKIENLEVVKGKLQIEQLFLNTNSFTDYQRKVAQDYVDYLNENVPKDSSNTISSKEADSILTASKIMLLESQKKNNKQSITIKDKEVALLKNELLIAQKFTDIILKLRESIYTEQEKLNNSRVDNQNESLKLIKGAAIVCLLLVVFFFVLLSTDFLKNSNYRKELELEKQKTDALLESREQLMATVSHDIKTPLQSVLGYSMQLLEQENSFQNRNKLVKIKSAAHYIEQLVLDLLDYVRMEKGKIKVFSQNFELNELLEETAQSIADLHQNSELQLQFHIDATENTTYYGDYNKVRQILYNLIGNAFKFTTKGTISIETKIESEKLFISIIDTGFGISAASFDKIFESFTQEHDQIEQIYGGTGLGLSICKKLVHLLHGNITLQSTLNKGSNFTIELPLVLAKPEISRKEITLTTCVILDDDSSQIELTKSFLAPYFETIYTFTNGYKALEFCENAKPDVVFTDLQMPEMDGYTFIEKFRNLENKQEIPVVIISGQIPNDDLPAASFYSDFLIKPYTPNQLINLLSKISGQDLKYKQISFDAEYFGTLKTFIGNDAVKLKKFITDYVVVLTEDITNLEQAVANKNNSEISRISHKMQTMVSQFEEKQLRKNLMKLEQVAVNTTIKKDLDNLFEQLYVFRDKLITIDIV